jgi:hypothetical protein
MDAEVSLSFNLSQIAGFGGDHAQRQKYLSIRNKMLEKLERKGFIFVDGPAMCQELESIGGLSDWEDFAASWSDLPLDSYMACAETYRRRRYEVFRTEGEASAIVRQPREAHHQSVAYNHLNGGAMRWYAPFRAELAAGSSFGIILEMARGIFETLSPIRSWHIEAHQFRIETTGNEFGEPTPEGVHRDGVNFALVMLINRENVIGGISTIYRDQHMLSIGNSTLMRPFDSLLLVDTRVKHGVSSISAKNPWRIGIRDALVVTFTQRQHEITNGVCSTPHQRHNQNRLSP